MARLEAILFLAREPLHPRRLAKFANLTDGTEAHAMIQRLNRFYDQAGRAFRVENVAGGWQLRTREKFAPWVRRMQQATPEVRLSPPSMETLVVVAYRQPVVRAVIEAVRGVNCGEVLRQLLEKDLIRVAGRSSDLGRPFFYATTRKFLEVFGLRDLSELPRADLFRGDQTGPIRESNHQVEGDTDVAVTEFRVGEESENKAWGSTALNLQVQALAKREEAEEDEEWEDEDEVEDDDEEWEDDDDEDEDWDDDGEEDDDEEEEEELEGEAEEELDEEEEEEWEEVDDDEEDDLDEDEDDDEWEDDDEEDEEEWEEEDEV